MTALSTQYLFEHYPALFEKSRFGGFSTGSGWDPLLTELFDAMQRFPDAPRIVQVKEKFGGLRVYTSHVHPEIDNLIRAAEDRASKTCEMCGTTEGVAERGGMWIKTLCAPCQEKRDYERGR